MKIDSQTFLALVAAIGAGGGMSATISANPLPAQSDSVDENDEGLHAQNSCVSAYSRDWVPCPGDPGDPDYERCTPISESLFVGTANEMNRCLGTGDILESCMLLAMANTCPTNEGMAFCDNLESMCGAAPADCGGFMSSVSFYYAKEMSQHVMNEDCTGSLWVAAEGLLINDGHY